MSNDNITPTTGRTYTEEEVKWLTDAMKSLPPDHEFYGFGMLPREVRGATGIFYLHPESGWERGLGDSQERVYTVEIGSPAHKALHAATPAAHETAPGDAITTILDSAGVEKLPNVAERVRRLLTSREMWKDTAQGHAKTLDTLLQVLTDAGVPNTMSREDRVRSLVADRDQLRKGIESIRQVLKDFEVESIVPNWEPLHDQLYLFIRVMVDERNGLRESVDRFQQTIDAAEQALFLDAGILVTRDDMSTDHLAKGIKALSDLSKQGKHLMANNTSLLAKINAAHAALTTCGVPPTEHLPERINCLASDGKHLKVILADVDQALTDAGVREGKPTVYRVKELGGREQRLLADNTSLTKMIMSAHSALNDAWVPQSENLHERIAQLHARVQRPANPQTLTLSGTLTVENKEDAR